MFAMKKIKSILLITTLLFTTSIQPHTNVEGNTLPFIDISNSYAQKEIISLYNQNIMKGTSATQFSPKKPISRAELMTTLIRLLGLETVNASIPAYSDVNRNAWYYGAIQASTEIELTEGTGDGKFNPNAAVTRQEAATWIVRTLKQGTSTTLTTGYKDNSSISDWAKPYVSIVSKLGFMEGSSGSFYPKQYLTRQETAMILDRLLQDDQFTSDLKKNTNRGIQLGWQYGQSEEEYKKSIMQSDVNILSPRWYFLNSDGSITDNTSPSLIKWAKQKDKKVWAMFGNRSNQEATHQLLSSSARSAAAIDEITQRVVDNGINGINLDFENVAPTDRAAFTSFTANLAKKLHSVGTVLSVDVSPNFNSDWTEAFDYKELGKSADYIVLMGYDEHWYGSIYPGPIASLAWVETGLDTLLSDVPNSKVILALPFYNRDWTLDTNGKSTSSQDISLSEQSAILSSKALNSIWDKELGQYTTAYWQNGVKHRLWIEDSRSLSLKYEMALDRGVAGFAYWHIGGETTEIWTSLRNVAKYHRIGK